jgi:hypothetical protein
MTSDAAASTPVSIDAALGKFRDMLASDGYGLSWSLTDHDKIVVHIEAGPDACADCLVPRPIMEAIMADALAPTLYSLDHIVLPTDAEH